MNPYYEWAKKEESDMKAKSVGDIVAGLVKAMRERYPEDETAPGVLISYIAEGNYFYVALKRFGAYGSGGYNVVVRQGANLFEVMKDVARSWLQANPANRKTARDELEELVG